MDTQAKQAVAFKQPTLVFLWTYIAQWLKRIQQANGQDVYRLMPPPTKDGDVYIYKGEELEL